MKLQNDEFSPVISNYTLLLSPWLVAMGNFIVYVYVTFVAFTVMILGKAYSNFG
jgi:hypothetical protein